MADRYRKLGASLKLRDTLYKPVLIPRREVTRPRRYKDDNFESTSTSAPRVSFRILPALCQHLLVQCCLRHSAVTYRIDSTSIKRSPAEQLHVSTFLSGATFSKGPKGLTFARCTVGTRHGWRGPRGGEKINEQEEIKIPRAPRAFCFPRRGSREISKLSPMPSRQK
ncbi:uncharacterized protein LOC143896910 [Temnothorax americanus]|uniref:uncharacterized protein LOC143896910 n=1 Tax=Temnothorax americanus TaxID=1964332 RepID=UPI004067FE4C